MLCPTESRFLSLSDEKCKHLSESTASFPTIRAEMVDPTCDPGWDSAVERHPDHTCFHTSAWAKVLCTTYGHKPFYLRFCDGPKLIALLPLLEISSPLTGRRGVCLPFSDFCEPLIFDGHDSEFVMARVSEFAQERNWKYFEVRGGKTLQLLGQPAVTFYGHTLDLRGTPPELFARVAAPARRSVRKAEKIGLSVEVSQAPSAVEEFYRLHIRTRRRHGLPPQPMSFFSNIQANIIKAGLGFVVLARNGARLVAAAMFFRSGKSAIYKFGASDKARQDLRGNNLVMWEAIKFLVQDGVEKLYLGRTSLENAGLRRFKLSWGTKEEIISYFRFDPRRHEWIAAKDRTSGLHNKVFRRLPLVLNRLAGAMVYPHLD
jgi:GNAT acetyltransferase-like protein